MAIGGNTLEEVIGLMTAGTEITQNASKVARGLVTVQSRLNQITDEESSTGQKLSAWYEQHNIEIYDQEGQLRKLYDVLKDVGAMWGDLTTNEKDYYLNVAAGANQSQNLAAILSNFGVALSSTATAYDSTNSAMKENERVLESVQAKQQALNAAFEEFSNKVVSSNALKGGLQLLTNLLRALDNEAVATITQFGLIGGTVLGFGTIAINIVPKIWGMAKAFLGISTAASALNPILLAVTVATAALGTIAIKAYDSWKEYEQELKEIRGGVDDLQKSIENSTKALEENKTNVEASVIVGKKYLDRIEELTAKESLTAEQQYELNELINRMNELFPDLHLGIEETTGKLNMETKAIEDQIRAWKRLAIEQGYQEEIGVQSKAIAQAQISKAKTSLQKNDYIYEAFGSQENYEAALAEFQATMGGKYNKIDASDTLISGLLNKAHYLDLGSMFGFKNTNELERALIKVREYNAALEDYDKEIEKAEDNLSLIQRTRDSMLEEDVGVVGSSAPRVLPSQNQAVTLGLSGEVVGGETGGSTGAGKPNLDEIIKGQAEVEEVLEKSFEEQYKDLKHNLTMDYIAEKEYYDSLEKLYKSFYEEGTEDYQKYEEEVYKGRKKLLEDEQSAKEKAESEAQRAAEKAKTEAERAAKEAERQAEKEQKAVEEAKQAAKAAYEKGFTDQLDTLEHKLAMDEITEEEYYTTLDALNQKFFKDKEEYLDKYWKYEEKIYSYRKKLAEQEQKEQEKALEDFKKLQEERIKALKDEVEAYNDLIKEQLDTLKSTEDAINDKYDAELAKLNETNEALEQQIEYEKMLEELARAKNTRKLVYSEGGYKYVEDTDAIASAQSKIDAYNRSKDLEAQKQALAWDRDLQLGAVADRRSALQAHQERWSNLSSLLGGVDSSMGDVDIIELMKANSASWGTATSTEEKEKLHEANLILNELLSEKGAFNSASGRWSMYADGTTSATGGLSLVGEQGAELRVLNHGDGIIPSGLTKNLMAWGAFDPKALMGVLGGGSTSINISNISLPNVSNAQEFLQGIQALATQYTFQRG